jgi:hypothetical protein
LYRNSGSLNLLEPLWTVQNSTGTALPKRIGIFFWLKGNLLALSYSVLFAAKERREFFD